MINLVIVRSQCLAGGAGGLQPLQGTVAGQVTQIFLKRLDAQTHFPLTCCPSPPLLQPLKRSFLIDHVRLGSCQGHSLPILPRPQHPRPCFERAMVVVLELQPPASHRSHAFRCRHYLHHPQSARGAARSLCENLTCKRAEALTFRRVLRELRKGECGAAFLSAAPPVGGEVRRCLLRR